MKNVLNHPSNMAFVDKDVNRQVSKIRYTSRGTLADCLCRRDKRRGLRLQGRLPPLAATWRTTWRKLRPPVRTLQRRLITFCRRWAAIFLFFCFEREQLNGTFSSTGSPVWAFRRNKKGYWRRWESENASYHWRNLINWIWLIIRLSFYICAPCSCAE